MEECSDRNVRWQTGLRNDDRDNVPRAVELAPSEWTVESGLCIQYGRCRLSCECPGVISTGGLGSIVWREKPQEKKVSNSSELCSTTGIQMGAPFLAPRSCEE